MTESTSAAVLYSDQFYELRTAAVQDCVRVLVPLIAELVGLASVVDFGCARGEWLQAFSAHGVHEIQGIDGPYVDQNQLQIPRERFIPANLADMEPLDRQFDLALCLEVAEHLPMGAAKHLVNLLTQAAPVVVFSAAIPGQTGVGHINCRWPDYWFWLRLSRTYEFVSTEKITANYRQHRAQISQDRRSQMVSVYRARQKLRDEVRRQGDAKLAAEIEQVMVEIWEDALRESWKRRNLEQLRFLLSLKRYLPRGSRLSVKLSILSSLRTTRDRLRQAWLGRGSANPTIDEAATEERSESLIP